MSVQQPDTNSLKELKEQIKELMPHLKTHNYQAHQELLYVEDDLVLKTRKKYIEINSRYVQAKWTSGNKLKNPDPLVLFKESAELFIDLHAIRRGMDEVTPERKSYKQAFTDKMNKLEPLFHENGFTKKHKIHPMPAMNDKLRELAYND